LERLTVAGLPCAGTPLTPPFARGGDRRAGPLNIPPLRRGGGGVEAPAPPPAPTPRAKQPVGALGASMAPPTRFSPRGSTRSIGRRDIRLGLLRVPDRLGWHAHEGVGVDPQARMPTKAWACHPIADPRR